MSETKVSIIIPTYNRADMVAKSIDSVLAQDFDGFEVIVSNDGSTDNTMEVLSQYGDRIVVVQGPNRGCAEARTRAIQAARGQLIVHQDSDDLMLPGRLAAQAAFMAEHPDVAVVSGNIIIEGDEQTNYLEQYDIDFAGQPWIIFDHPFQKLLCGNFMADPASMVRRECFLAVGGYDLSLRRSADWDLWLKMARRWPLACMNMPCTWVGKHKGNICFSTVERTCNMRIIDRALRYGEHLDQDVLKRVKKWLYGLIWSYMGQNLMSPAEPLWQVEVRRCAEHLPWHQRLLLSLTTMLPRVLSGPVFRQVFKTRAAFRRKFNNDTSSIFNE